MRLVARLISAFVVRKTNGGAKLAPGFWGKVISVALTALLAWLQYGAEEPTRPLGNTARDAVMQAGCCGESAAARAIEHSAWRAPDNWSDDSASYARRYAPSGSRLLNNNAGW